jgi:hypothetical protein
VHVQRHTNHPPSERRNPTIKKNVLCGFQEGLWQTVVRKKYMRDKPMSLQKKQGQSQFWKGILEVQELFYKNSKKMEMEIPPASGLKCGMVIPPFQLDSKYYLSFL